jgi:hypothetical protein
MEIFDFSTDKLNNSKFEKRIIIVKFDNKQLIKNIFRLIIFNISTARS